MKQTYLLVLFYHLKTMPSSVFDPNNVPSLASRVFFVTGGKHIATSLEDKAQLS